MHLAHITNPQDKVIPALLSRKELNTGNTEKFSGKNPARFSIAQGGKQQNQSKVRYNTLK
jgi:hypothetical protein